MCLFFRGAMQTEDIVRKRFHHSVWGYDIREVDAFLDQICEAIHEMEKDQETLFSEMERLKTAKREAVRKSERSESAGIAAVRAAKRMRKALEESGDAETEEEQIEEEPKPLTLNIPEEFEDQEE